MTGPGNDMLSIIIVNWNTRDLLRQCLASLPWDDPALPLEVIVADNGSDDDSVAMVEAEFPQVRLIRNEANVGFVRATNQGLRAATGDFLLLLNSDTEVQPGALERLVQALDEHPEAGAVGPALLNTDGTPQVSFGPLPRMIHRFFPDVFESRCRRRVWQAAHTTRRPIPVGWLGGAALLTRREVLRRVGCLDERWFMWYDDLDWCRRLQQAGYSRLFVADAAVIHHGRQSGGKLSDRRLAEQLWDSEYLYLRVHEGRAATCAVFLLRMAKAALRLLRAGAAREDARFRLAYHRSRWRRSCRDPLPPPQTCCLEERS